MVIVSSSPDIAVFCPHVVVLCDGPCARPPHGVDRSDSSSGSAGEMSSVHTAINTRQDVVNGNH